ncbi:DegT/DnrJ/EryC1/StrS family aminotransferase [Candidatus Marinarcus aquaticus]|uniref:UDP-4-amino-4, 6-dideoxy-N-acetyl-beta-L-altrosamine transaminase n=1 Tax=Candidatus Marinarcus aquaticus TaxID=2044504 RepID=A0A4Q0XN15_9BACT|nr:DegT/DnrJ/EryC1/StrS family aminotransferase [Candidatus Marinarcus aquaticus]RXJ55386.1 UDP-4-amino-4,6-dideoxy-N-acetyl-beta-L-altrosamine transaminase [Candidatus Marinarcus aquaticus]
MKVDFFKHNIDETDIDRVNAVLRSVFLTNANVTSDFEKRFSHYMKSKECVAVNSCTAALHLSLLAWGIKEGDEVITTSMSFIATANAILHSGAKPVFVDVEPETYLIDCSKIEDAITPNTKAILPVHLYGQMCDMKEINKIAKRHNLIVIEDAAHCIEGERDGIKVGELSHAACFSFYATKNITSGEGGAIICQDESKAEYLRKLRLHGMSKDASSRYYGKFSYWDMEILGWKYNISDIQSALLIGQLERIEDLLSKRKKIVDIYEEKLKKNLEIKRVKYLNTVKQSYHLYVIHVKNRDEVIHKLNQKGISVAVNYNPIHLTSFYRTQFNYERGTFLVTENWGEGCISLPLYPTLEHEKVNYVADCLIDIVKEKK